MPVHGVGRIGYFRVEHRMTEFCRKAAAVPMTLPLGAIVCKYWTFHLVGTRPKCNIHILRPPRSYCLLQFICIFIWRCVFLQWNWKPSKVFESWDLFIPSAIIDQLVHLLSQLHDFLEPLVLEEVISFNEKITFESFDDRRKMRSPHDRTCILKVTRRQKNDAKVKKNSRNARTTKIINLL